MNHIYSARKLKLNLQTEWALFFASVLFSEGKVPPIFLFPGWWLQKNYFNENRVALLENAL